MNEKLGTLLNAKFTKSELVYLIVSLENEKNLRAPGADWTGYYASSLIKRYLAG